MTPMSVGVDVTQSSSEPLETFGLPYVRRSLSVVTSPSLENLTVD